MDFGKVNSIKLGFLNAEGDVDSKTKKCDYKMIASGTLSVTLEIKNQICVLNEEDKFAAINQLLMMMYEDISKNVKEPADTLGFWIDYDGEKIDNAMKLQTLEDIKNYGTEGISPVLEFFKMTVPK